MAKKKQVTETTEQKEEEPMKEVSSELKQAAPLTELALGVVKTKDGWGVAQIAYNAETGESDLQDIHLAGTSRDDAIELFKITAVEKGLV